jgi:hypothetical protein
MRRSREHSTLIPPRSPTTPFPEPQMRARGPHHQRPCSTVRAGPPARPESSRPNGAQRVVAHRRRRGTRRVVTAVTRHAQQHHVHRPLASEWRVLRCPRARRLPPCHLPLGHLEGGEQRHEESRPSHACDTGGSNFLRSPRTPHHGGRVMSFPFFSRFSPHDDARRSRGAHSISFSGQTGTENQRHDSSTLYSLCLTGYFVTQSAPSHLPPCVWDTPAQRGALGCSFLVSPLSLGPASTVSGASSRGGVSS